MTQPMPPIQQDPALLKAQQAHDDFDTQAQAIREDFNLSDLAIAEKLSTLWESSNKTIAAAYQDLQRRREARLDQLQAAVPIGPNLPDDLSPADRAVLMQAFRSALVEAREASTDDLRPMFDDAEMFDDDIVRRAVLTALVERSRLDVVRAWWADSNGVSDQLDELVSLQSGNGVWALKVSNAFAPIPKPAEVWDLPLRQAARDAAQAARR
ncbi:MAG: hypothetical protein JWP40_2431 [Blastococcus sp.]|nr:hypothetical protein [Blastococcus sp.]